MVARAWSRRTASEIGVHSIRGGDVVGDHNGHLCKCRRARGVDAQASSRDTFANGALRAAQWVVKPKAGLYDMDDVWG